MSDTDVDAFGVAENDAVANVDENGLREFQTEGGFTSQLKVL